jgi:tRNA dimethylallyltransferase
LSVAQDPRLARHDRSQVSLEAIPPDTQSGVGMVAAARPAFDFVAHYGTPTGATKQPCTSTPLVAIAGPTASGKSALALYLAGVLGGEIVNYDSVQVYRGLDIGSGKVSREERLRIPHHLLDVLSSDQSMTAGEYRRLARKTLAEIAGRGKVPVLAGGTGLYLRALLRGLFEGPARCDPLRAHLRGIEERRGRGFLHKLLRRLDSEAARRIHPHDVQKLLRALEVCLLSGQSISRLHQQGRDALAGFRIVKIGLNPDRDELRERINRRVESMFASGLIQEARAMLDGRGASTPTGSGPLSALGYRQACQFLRGEISLAEAVRDTQSATRRYSKRQLTWFRAEPDVNWFHGFGDDPDLQRRVSHWLIRTLANAPTWSEILSRTGLNCPSAERTYP